MKKLLSSVQTVMIIDNKHNKLKCDSKTKSNNLDQNLKIQRLWIVISRTILLLKKFMESKNRFNCLRVMELK